MLSIEERNEWIILLSWSFYLSGNTYIASLMIVFLCYWLMPTFYKIKKALLLKQCLIILVILKLSLFLVRQGVAFIFLLALSFNLSLFLNYLKQIKNVKGCYLWYFLTFSFYTVAIFLPTSLFTLNVRYHAITFISIIFLPLAFIYLGLLLRKEKQMLNDIYCLK